MVGLPSFLQRSYKFPRSSVVDVEDRDRAEEDEGYIPSHRHRNWGMAFELSVSYEALLETEDASELLFEFLTHDYTSSATEIEDRVVDAEEDAEEEEDSEEEAEEEEEQDAEEEEEEEEEQEEEELEEEQEEEQEEEENSNNDGDEDIEGWDFDSFYGRYGPAVENKIVWMSDSVVIFSLPCYKRRFHDHFDHDLCKVYSINLFEHNQEICYDKVRMILQPSATLEKAAALESDAAPEAACPSIGTDAIDGMDVLLRLVAKNKHLRKVGIVEHPQYGHDLGVTTTVFPASLNALEALVGEVQTGRALYLQHAGLSLEQWRTITRNVSKNVPIEIYYVEDDRMLSQCEIDSEVERERPAFMEAAIQDHCPAKIKISHLELASADKRQLLLSAFEQTTFLEALDVDFDVTDKECFALCMGTISRNRSLRRLRLELWDATDDIDTEQSPSTEKLQFTDTEWELFCNAIAAHPTLQDVEVHSTLFRSSLGNLKKMLIRMIRQNTVLCEFQIGHYDDQDCKFCKTIFPVLEFNRAHQVAQCIKKEADPVHQKQLFTKALLSWTVRRRPCFRYLLLRNNSDVLEEVTVVSERKIFCKWQETMRYRVLLETTMRDRGLEIPSSREEDEITWLARGCKH